MALLGPDGQPRDCATCENYESKTEQAGWRLDKKIPLVAVVAMMLTAASVGGGWVWWFSGQARSLDAVTQQLVAFSASAQRWDNLVGSVAVLTSSTTDQGRRLRVLEDAESRRDGQITLMTGRLARIEGLLEVLVKQEPSRSR